MVTEPGLLYVHARLLGTAVAIVLTEMRVIVILVIEPNLHTHLHVMDYLARVRAK